MNANLDQSRVDATTERPRLFLHELGWQIALKIGSEKTFCFTMAPGQDFYHRLQDGEVYVYRGDERLCLACAERRGVLSHEPRTLREPGIVIDLAPPATTDYAVEPPGEAESSG